MGSERASEGTILNAAQQAAGAAAAAEAVSFEKRAEQAAAEATRQLAAERHPRPAAE